MSRSSHCHIWNSHQYVSLDWHILLFRYISVNYIFFSSDHFFDTSARRRTKQHAGKASDVSKPRQTARGCLPVRVHHAANEERILHTTRLGIKMSGPNDIMINI